MIINHPTRVAFTKVVKGHFAKAGWTVESLASEHCDFAISSHSLKFRIRCLDESCISYRSATLLIEEMERSTNYLLSSVNLVCLTILSRNFIGADLGALRQRGIFVSTISDIKSLSDLIHVSKEIPHNLSEAQLSLLKKNVDYAIFVSDLYKGQSEYNSALSWARIALEASYGFTEAYFHLFDLYLRLERSDEAEELGKVMFRHRPHNPRVISRLVKLSLIKGDEGEAERLKQYLTADNTPAVTLEGILEKQRKKKIDLPTEQASPVEKRQSTFSRSILKRLLRQ